MEFAKVKFKDIKDGEKFLHFDEDDGIIEVQKVWCTYWDDIVNDHYTIHGDFTGIPFNAVYSNGMLDWFPDNVTVFRVV